MEAAKLMDSIIAITTALAKEMKAKKAKNKRLQEAQLAPLTQNRVAHRAATACR
jgi:hypothetical protein